jgi:HSP20 family protein
MSEPKKTRKPEEDISIDLGMGGLFKGLGNFLDLLSDLVEKADDIQDATSQGGGESGGNAAPGGGISRSGEFKVKGLGDKGRGVYGFSVRTTSAGMPRVEHFGNIRTTQEGPEVAEVREPMVDVFDEANEIVIVAELPGVGEDEVHVEIKDDVLSLETSGERKYAKEILLPAAVNTASLHKIYKNGILELRLQKG